ncbi:MAG: serine hydrolase [Draconibacterium sp.]|nr:MAG: serine hydrolase [Draconibacterium sp.]
MKAKKLIPIVLLAILLIGFFYLNPLLPIITGYAAKNLSSGVFVANRTQKSMEATDLNFSFIKLTRNKINSKDKMVKSGFLWNNSSTVFTEGYGSVLAHDFTKETIKARPYQNLPVLPQRPDTIPWPMGSVVADTIPPGINMELLDAALNQAFSGKIPFKGTFAVTVVYKGQIIAEKFADGFNAENKFLSWSMAKSFTNALTGILVKQGKIDINKPAPVEEWQKDERRNITVNNLLHMNSGLEWNEDYGNSSDVNNMLFKKGDMAAFAFSKPLEYQPDSLWEYSSGSTNIVSWIIRKTLGNDADYYAFPRRELFNKTGMRSVVFEVDASGTFVGSSYLYATMRDYARFGLLYLNNGNWLGEQILPENWVAYSTSEANGSEGQYGAFFWINKSGKNYPDVPRDMFSCNGHDGQFIYIIPSRDLVVVRTGFSKKEEFDNNRFLASIVNSVE